ncbi:MAG: hypothetical protein PF508_10540, partial [Spirochaeta sp.]|jgi:hypothetical protein|nr:hypothetical protein [Spirochaeta sp.]
MRALWQPRLLEAIDWIAAEIAASRAAETTAAPAVEPRSSASTAGADVDAAALEAAIAAAIDPPEDFLGTTVFKPYLNAVKVTDCIQACIREAS